MSSNDSNKRAADGNGEESAAKKQKTGVSFNVNKALDKAHEGKSFTDIIKLPPSALEGLGDRADKMLKHFKINTIEDLGKWRFFLIARAIVSLAATEEKNKRADGARSNINKALDKEFETQSLKEIVKAPPSALQGLAQWSDDVLKPLKVRTIGELGAWKFPEWAEAFTLLAQYESADGSS